jgi:hypothetical protein
VAHYASEEEVGELEQLGVIFGRASVISVVGEDVPNTSLRYDGDKRAKALL